MNANKLFSRLSRPECRLSRIKHVLLIVVILFFTAKISLFYFASDRYETEPIPMVHKMSTDQPKTSSMRFKIYRHNFDQTISLRRSNFTAVFIIQVHNRTGHLDLLIQSLRGVAGIDDALLVFSHDVYDEAINSLVTSIQFASVLQIFYPHSTQFYESRFPGQSLDDCQSKSHTVNCLNSGWSDHYGHYREPRVSQVKLHWLWKLIFVMEEVKALNSFNGPVLLLEEDYYVTADLLKVIKLAHSMNAHPHNVLSVGSYSLDKSPKMPNHLLGLKKWYSSKDNIGLVLNRALYAAIKPCLEEHFCYYDDYNWDWTFQYLLQHCPTQPVTVISRLGLGRVYHTGSCGNCDATAEVRKIEDYLQSVKEYLHPDHLERAELDRHVPVASLNGGFADVRDRTLCRTLVRGRWLQMSTDPLWARNPHRNDPSLDSLIFDQSSFTNPRL